MKNSNAIGRRNLSSLILMSLVSGACARRYPIHSPEGAPDPNAYSGPMTPPEKIPWNFLWQQRVFAQHGDAKGSFNAVVQKRGAELLVLGLTPFQTRGFSLTQRGVDFEYEQYVPFDLPFSPGSVLIDLHRAFFFGLLGDIPREGKRVLNWQREMVTDLYKNQKLMAREYLHVGRPGGRIAIDYGSDGYSPGTPSNLVVLDNQAYGYRLRVETIDAQKL